MILNIIEDDKFNSNALGFGWGNSLGCGNPSGGGLCYYIFENANTNEISDQFGKGWGMGTANGIGDLKGIG